MLKDDETSEKDHNFILVRFSCCVEDAHVGDENIEEEKSEEENPENDDEYLTEMDGKDIEEEKLIMKYIDTEGCEFIPITEYENT